MPTNIWFTSDLHLNHKMILLWRTQFSSLEEMNETIIERWNNVVIDTDLVYLLGDVILGSAKEAVDLLERLNGRIYLIRGNHDRVAEHKLCMGRFEWIKDYHRIKKDDQKIYLFHYPIESWDCQHYGSWHLHGHCHNSLAQTNRRRLDVGVDGHDFKPWHYDEISEFMKSRTFTPVDHHD